jgi:hypothetical protein
VKVYSVRLLQTPGNDVHFDPNITQSSDDHHRDTLSVDHRGEIHGIRQTTHGYLFLFTFPPSMLSCSWFRDLMFVVSRLFF